MKKRILLFCLLASSAIPMSGQTKPTQTNAVLGASTPPAKSDTNSTAHPTLVTKGVVPSPAHPPAQESEAFLARKPPIELGGIVGKMATASPRRNPLQYLNPLAPPEYGSGATPPYQWDPFAGPNPLVRSISDARLHEPRGLVLFSIHY